MMDIYPTIIIDALRNVRYPGTGRNVVEMNMVGDDIRIAGLHVTFSLHFDRPADPFLKSLLKACEAAIHAHVSHDVEVEITPVVRQREVEQPALLPHVRNIISVASGKGGVGKSTVAANLAIALAQMGLRVGLLDCDISGPSVPKMLHVEDARPYSESIDGRDLIVPVEKYGVRTLSIGFFVDPEKPTLWRGGMACNALKQMIGDAAWGKLDYLVLDTPPGTSDIHLTLVQTIPLTGAIVVSTPQEVALADARKGINMYLDEKVGVPVLGLVENMAWFTPAEHPDEQYYIFGREGVRHLSEQLGVPLLGQIPLTESLCESGDTGIPPALDPTSPMGHAFAQLAASVVTATDRRNMEREATHVVQVKS